MDQIFSADQEPPRLELADQKKLLPLASKADPANVLALSLSGDEEVKAFQLRYISFTNLLKTLEGEILEVQPFINRIESNWAGLPPQAFKLKGL